MGRELLVLEALLNLILILLDLYTLLVQVYFHL